MVFIDYLSLLLINVTVGYVLLSWYAYAGFPAQERGRWVIGFTLTGGVAFVGGLYMAFTWPLPGAFNSAFGEMSVLFGATLLGAAWALAKDWDLLGVAAYAFFAGWASVLVGARIVDLHLTKNPLLSGLGFLLSGLSGIAAAPTLMWFRQNRPFRLFATAVLLATAGIWAANAYGAYWSHLQGFAHWVPRTVEAAVRR